MPKFVACKFRPEDTRTYTYEWDGESLAPGDVVKVADRSGDGWKRVWVDSISDKAPPFECKPILGKVEPEPEGDVDMIAMPAPQPDTSALGAPLPF